MGFRSEHRPPPPLPQPDTKVTEPATVEAAQADYAGRGGLQSGQVTATFHTLGRQS